MTTHAVRVGRQWLALREPADAAARARDLVERLRREVAGADRWTVHDLGCGTGGMGRWLAPQLPGRQRWVLHDRDPDLLEIAASEHPGAAADGAAVSVEPRRSDITRMGPGDLAGATLITASALLDMLTGSELTAMIAACSRARCPILVTLSVTGRVRLSPAERLDGRVAAAFNAHQRRVTERGRLLGPDAVGAAARGFARVGAEVLASPSPWRLGAEQSDLLVEWLAGWVGAACEQDPKLDGEVGPYMRRRVGQATAGELRVIVEHSDLLVWPRAGRPDGEWKATRRRDPGKFRSRSAP